MIFTLSNFLSILRIPLAFVLLLDNTLYRALAISLAMLTDSLDGYLARRMRVTSQVGAFLDPLGDKFFVIFAISVFVHEGYLTAWQVAALLSRDIALMIFSSYLYLKGRWSEFPFQSFWCGKISTFFQFLVLLSCTFHYLVPGYFFSVFIILGVMSVFELYSIDQKLIKQKASKN